MARKMPNSSKALSNPAHALTMLFFVFAVITKVSVAGGAFMPFSGICAIRAVSLSRPVFRSPYPRQAGSSVSLSHQRGRRLHGTSMGTLR